MTKDLGLLLKEMERNNDRFLRKLLLLERKAFIIIRKKPRR
jgi:hypothetical protein